MSSVIDSDTPVVEKTGAGSAKPGIKEEYLF
jgi:hypothetical protein